MAVAAHCRVEGVQMCTDSCPVNINVSEYQLTTVLSTLGCVSNRALLQVVAVVSELQRRKASLAGLPLYAVGASSGGAFALTITAYLRFSGETLGLCPAMCRIAYNTTVSSSYVS
jgi:hypothetical protein